MSIYIYTGLSLPFSDARKLLSANYLPPVKRDDINRLLDEKDDVDTIGIIDGVFHQSPAVSHKEILRALNEDILVVGGASMGALRACELYPYGMVGVGSIFEDYKTGVIESDDDVAVALNPETFEQLSESLVNIRYNLTDAKNEGIINADELDELLDITKNIYYPKRSFDYVIKKSSLTQEKREMLIKFLDENKYDIKRVDAIKVVEYIKNNVK